MSTLSQILKKEGGFNYKRLIVDTFVEIIKNSPENKEKALEYLSEYIEDCEFTNLTTRILHLLGEEGPTTSHPMTYIRSIYNRMILETEAVRASAVNSLAQYSKIEPDAVSTLLSQCILDSDDQVRDKTTFYLSLLEEQKKNEQFEINSLLNPKLSYPVENLEASLMNYIEEGGEDSFDITTVPLEEKQTRIKVEKKDTKGIQPFKKITENVPKVQDLFGRFGKLLKSSRRIPLTEQETEYQVSLVKHIFPNHIILEFLVVNTLDDIALNNVLIDIEPTVDGWNIENNILCDTPIKPHETGTTYTIIPIPEDDIPKSKFNCVMKFDIIEIDPDTFELIEDSEVSDEYPIDSFVL